MNCRLGILNPLLFSDYHLHTTATLNLDLQLQHLHLLDRNELPPPTRLSTLVPDQSILPHLSMQTTAVRTQPPPRLQKLAGNEAKTKKFH